jgi:hypothetical protein
VASFTPELTATGFALFRAGVKVSAGTCEDLTPWTVSYWRASPETVARHDIADRATTLIGEGITVVDDPDGAEREAWADRC